MSKKNEKYFSIGHLSKLSGVHIKSLRYYDEIGILPPAYVDQKTGYRYYSQHQLLFVETIKLCVELDVPLKLLPTFLSADRKQLDIGRLVAYGTQLAEEKFRIIKEKQEMLLGFQEELERVETLTNCPQQYHLREKICWIEPFTGTQQDASFFKVTNQLMLRLKEMGLKMDYEVGLLAFWKGNIYKQYIFVDLAETDTEHPAIISIPASDYWCRKVEKNMVETHAGAFENQVDSHSWKVLLEVDMLTCQYDYFHPSMELRCTEIAGIGYPEWT